MPIVDGHKFVSIDIETTGDNYKTQEIWELACIPLNDNLEFDRNYNYFNIIMKPNKPDNIDWDVMRRIGRTKSIREAIDFGIPQERGADLFYSWVVGLNLPPNKRLIPVCTNWAGIDKIFIQYWMGADCFQSIFDGRYRDVMSVAAYLNDKQFYRNEAKIFTDLKLTTICKKFGIEYDSHKIHNALEDARLTAQVYKKLCEL